MSRDTARNHTSKRGNLVMNRAAIATAVIALLLAQAAALADPAASPGVIRAPGLHRPASVVRDVDGIPHVYAWDEHDALFLQGWLQANDRLFQLDVLRRTVSGTLAELVGSSALPNDVELQVIGLRRAAQRSFAAYSPEARAGLQAYADGVNAWVAANPLPAEYAALELTKFSPWTPVDCVAVAKGLAFQLSFDLDISATLTYLSYQEKLAPINPLLPDALFFLDVFRSAPFDPAASIPDANGAPPRLTAAQTNGGAEASRSMHAMPYGDGTVKRMLENYRGRMERVPFLRQTLQRREQQVGSNEWAVSGRFTRNGRPLVANDPHLSLNLPPNFYDLQLSTIRDGLNVIGSSVAGTPWIVLGQNRSVTWGETTTGFDVTDTYQEQVVPDPGSPSGLSTLYKGGLEHVIPVPLAFRVNVVGDGVADDIVPVPSGGAIPPVALIVPRRNNGPIVDLDQATGRAISVQYTGFGATRELETFRLLNRARNLDDFKAALQFFDAGSQNFIYGDVQGNIGYFTTGEVPLREDLQANTVNGAPPWFIRNGQGGNEWLLDPAPSATNGTGYQSVPFAELPQIVNPPAGFVVNANNDPAGVTLDNNPINQLRPGNNGIYYLGYSFDFGTRAGRITQALRSGLERGRVGMNDMQRIQADVVLLDAQVLAPYIVRAYDNARVSNSPPELSTLAADPRVAEAVGRLRDWDYTTPTGTATGYDASDEDGHLLPPTGAEVKASIAATIYSVWRGQAIRNGIDVPLGALGVPTPDSADAVKALRHLVERDGIGESTIDFFASAGLPQPGQRRDFVLLKSLADALDALAGPSFETAFHGSQAQADYRWGRLHRIVFDAVLGQPFSIPGATPGFPPSFNDLDGLAVDGGFGVVDASSHSARAADSEAFQFGSGPNRRYVGAPGTVPGSIEAETILPGGDSGVLGNKFYVNLLGRYLTNETYPMRQSLVEVLRNTDSVRFFSPAP
jgi:penicillin amidase